ncbi:right-handed parallel beta-helix repeat-containing protein [Candidatus Woesearchaeota archaeon]|nr:right-handed parallel beta-helix repeat-containing protein [Candidatus Woesearchaeota archaeon]
MIEQYGHATTEQKTKEKMESSKKRKIVIVVTLIFFIALVISLKPRYVGYAVAHVTDTAAGNEIYETLTAAMFWLNGTYNTTIVINDSNRDYILSGKLKINRTDMNLTDATRVFDFEETSGASVTDYSSEGIDGALYGDYDLNNEGSFSSGLYFNGTANGFLNLTKEIGGLVTGNVTVLLMLKPYNNTANCYNSGCTILGQINPGTFAGTLLYLNADRLQWMVVQAGGAAANATQDTITMDYGYWNCIAATSEQINSNDRNISLWVYNRLHGGLQDSTIASLPLTNTTAYVGDVDAVVDVPLNGTIDELRIYNHKLDDDTIRSYCYGKLDAYRISPGYQQPVIDIRAENVTLDFNGSTLFNLNNTDELQADGITSLSGPYANVTVKRAIVRAFRRYSIALGGPNSKIDNCTVRFARNLGIGVVGENSSVTNSLIQNLANNTALTDPPLGAIYVSADNVLVENNTIISSSTVGISLTSSQNSTVKTNNISGTYKWGAENCSDILLQGTSSDNEIYLNHLLSCGVGNITSSPESNIFCVDGEGNFYIQNITPAAGDCGQANVTFPLNEIYQNNNLNITWKKQSSFLTVNYDIFLERITPYNLTLLTNTTSLYYFLNLTNIYLGSYRIIVVPWINGPRYNTTKVYSQNFTINNTPPTIVSVFLNSTSEYNLTSDNLTAFALGISDPDNDSVSINYNWFRNGTSITLLNIPFTAPNATNYTLDFSSPAHHGRFTTDGVYWRPSGGYDGFGAFEFRGFSLDSIKCESCFGFNETNNFTIELWAKPTATHEIDIESNTSTNGTSGQRYAINPPQGNAWGEGHAGAGISIGTNGVSVYEHATNYMPPVLVWEGTLNDWTHVVVVYENRIPKLYINGAYVKTGLTSNKSYIHPGPWETETGGIGGGAWGGFKGFLDDVRVYNKSLSSEEITLLFNNRTDMIYNSGTSKGENWSVKITPIDQRGLNGSILLSNGINITNSAPALESVFVNATSSLNLTVDNLTAYISGISDPDNDSVSINYNWFRNGVSETLLNMPFTALTENNRTYDFSGFNNNGLIVNSTFNSAGGYDGRGAYDFNGIDQYILSSTLDDQDFGRNMTLCAWAKLKSNNSDKYIIGINSYNAQHLRFESSTYTFVFQHHWKIAPGALYMDLSSTTVPELDTWYYVCGVLVTINAENSTQKIYVNGVEEASAEVNGTMAYYGTDGTWIGVRRGDTLVSYWNGTIDEVLVYNRSLSSNEIYLLYQNRTDIKHPDATSKFDSWSVAATPIDSEGINGSTVTSNTLYITSHFPTKPSLVYPADEDVILDRTPYFNWSASTDLDEDQITYNLLLDNNLDFSSPEINVTVTDSNYTPPSDMSFSTYYWKVIASDGVNKNESSTYNFDLITSIACSLPTNSIDFGQISLGQTKNTTGDSPPPLIIQNNGNVKLNITINSTDLWQSKTNPDEYFQFKIVENEAGAYTSAITAWTDFTKGTPLLSIVQLKYPDNADDARVDVLVKSPPDEGSGEKSATIQLWCENAD